MTLSVSRLLLDCDSTWEHNSAGDISSECAVHILTGSCTVATGGRVFRKLGERADVFSGLPTTLLLGQGTYRIVTESFVDALIFTYTHPDKQPQREPILLRPQDMQERAVGEGAHRRTVRPVVTAEHTPYVLRLGETLQSPGHWSSWPVHAGEVAAKDFKEKFVYFMKPASGFAVQMLNGEDRAPARIVASGDILDIPQGFHPVIAGPETEVLYVWAFTSSSGMEKTYSRFADEPVGLYQV